MTREEELNKAKEEFYRRMLKEGDYYSPRGCFEEGVEWADEHPKSSWISVDEDLPCNHKELLHSNYTDRVLVLSRDGYSEVAFMSKIEDSWGWSTFIDVKYWMPIPELE